MAGLMRNGSNALATLSKNDYVNSKFISAISVGLLPFAAKCPTKSVRLEAFSVISSAIVEYDLSGRDAGVGVTMKALLTSDSWRGVVDSGDSSVASELMCCMSQSLLDASRKICKCPDPALRLTLKKMGRNAIAVDDQDHSLPKLAIFVCFRVCEGTLSQVV
ncbi:hypothetical protein FGB62_251g011 [Gracilaria domingensis]|nr:hypothetical protein FGB62_251g011 [Gracilaria domingensis]